MDKNIYSLIFDDIYEIRFHGRGGQGAKTAAATLAEAAMEKGKFVQSFPEFGAERRGAPVKAYTRISDKPITVHSPVTRPNLVVVIDPNLIQPDVIEGLKENGKILVNSTKSIKEIKKELGFKWELYVLDATKISLEEIGKNIPNTPTLGAIIKITNLVSLDEIKEKVKAIFQSKLSQQIIDKNMLAIDRGYNELKWARKDGKNCLKED